LTARAWAIALGGAAIAATAAWRATRSTASRAEVPAFVVAEVDFVHRVSAEGNLKAVKATSLGAPSSSSRGAPMKLAWLAPDGSRVKKGDVVIRFDASDPERQLRDGKGDLDAADAKLREETIKSRAAVDGRDSDASLAARELDQQRHFQSKDEQIFSRNQIIESEIDEKLATSKQQHAEQAKQIERHLSRSKAAVIGVERAKAQLAITHANEQLAKLEVRAPHDGVFVLQRDWRGDVPKVGDQMWPNQTIGEIPLLDTMEAELFVLEVDGSGLAEGQPVELVVESRPDVVHRGKVRLVDKLAKPRQDEVPVQYFGVAVALDKTDPVAMKPGQRVRATLVLDRAHALVVPREAIVDKDGKSVVYRAGERGFDPVEVELGAATSGRVVVKKGLAAGDRVALRDPTRALDSTAGSAVTKQESAP
jgi:multidrug efflux pump subunit AcrA (membrane-fusion protein)